MGIIYNNAALMAKAKQANFSFDTILTIGKQSLFLSKRQMNALLSHYKPDAKIPGTVTYQYADDFLKILLDAGKVMSLDYSDYEGCDIVHDMNVPIDRIHYETFDAVIDGGSIEHIFNFPVAIANNMNMVKKGGSLFIFTMANNHPGHGFYQFSPELFFRIFQPENGFTIRDVILEKHPFPGSELSGHNKCYKVVDPVTVRTRVGLVSDSPVMIMVHAVRTDIKPIFSRFPIQSDYEFLYETKTKSGTSSSSLKSLTKLIRKSAYGYLPAGIKNSMTGWLQLRRYSFSNKRFYTRWYPL